MHIGSIMYLGRAVGVAAFLAASLIALSAWQVTGQTVPIDEDDLGGVVTGPNGPEPGVWVIAETTDLPTRFIRIVVTDDQGRYVVPDLPSANYQVWVRGYGLVDSPKVSATSGRSMNLSAVLAPDPLAAAQYFPAGYWYSLLRVPEPNEFPGTGPQGNGIAMETQAQWVRNLKTGDCWSCHSLGNAATRRIPESLGHFESSMDAWDRRIQSGQAGGDMVAGITRLGRQRAVELFADWTDRIAAGAVPPSPARPQGAERNLVVTLWDWADPQGYLHDQVSTDKRNPTVNAYGRIYGAMELSKDYLPVLDPLTHTTDRVPLTLRDPSTPPAAAQSMPQPSPYWGEETIWNSRNNVHNPMFDELGRLWVTSRIRPPQNPDFCREGSDHPSAQLFPLDTANRHLAMYDPGSGELTHIDTCFSTHHLVFAEDANHTLWTSGGGQVVGWLNRRMYDETGDEAASQGWTVLVLDTNGNGQRDAYVEADQPIDLTMDKRVVAGFYGVAVSPDGIIWGSTWSSTPVMPGSVVRLDPGPNPPFTALAEIFELPWDQPGVANVGFGTRGLDVDRDGVVWTGLASGHLASFDRRKCHGLLNGPTATGQHCPEGWNFYAEPIPQFEGVTLPGSAGSSYYTWVDQFDTLGLGSNVPINTGNAAEGLLALKDGEWVVLRVPYPMGFFAKWMDGRIDDPNAGWKGRGTWATVSTRTNWHLETGVGTTSKVLKFQLRPDPLAH